MVVLISTYASPLSTLGVAIVSYAAHLYQDRATRDEYKKDIRASKEELKADIHGVKDELKTGIGRVMEEVTWAGPVFTTDSQYGQGVSVVSG